MFGLSFGHMIILLVVILLLFGSRKLPELGAGLGKGLRAFKKGLEGGDEFDSHSKSQSLNDHSGQSAQKISDNSNHQTTHKHHAGCSHTNDANAGSDSENKS